MDPADLSSYRPISQLPFESKLVERAVASRFVHIAMSMELDCCLPGSQPTVTIRPKRLSSSFTVTLSDRSTDGRL